MSFVNLAELNPRFETVKRAIAEALVFYEFDLPPDFDSLGFQGGFANIGKHRFLKSFASSVTYQVCVKTLKHELEDFFDVDPDPEPEPEPEPAVVETSGSFGEIPAQPTELKPLLDASESLSEPDEGLLAKAEENTLIQSEIMAQTSTERELYSTKDHGLLEQNTVEQDLSPPPEALEMFQTPAEPPSIEPEGLNQDSANGVSLDRTGLVEGIEDTLDETLKMLGIAPTMGMKSRRKEVTRKPKEWHKRNKKWVRELAVAYVGHELTDEEVEKFRRRRERKTQELDDILKLL